MITAATGDALLAAILAEPDDDLHRLAYADWLEETGTDLPRAEFIRAAVEAGCDATGWTNLDWLEPRAQRLSQAWRELGGHENKSFVFGLPFGWKSWLGGNDDVPHAVFRRGFVHTVRCPLGAWLGHGPALARRHPVQRVEATDKRPVHAPYIARDEGVFWGWFKGRPDNLAPKPHLLRQVWELLEGALPVGGYVCWKAYSTENAAQDALSAALLAAVKPKGASGPRVLCAGCGKDVTHLIDLQAQRYGGCLYCRSFATKPG